MRTANPKRLHIGIGATCAAIVIGGVTMAPMAMAACRGFGWSFVGCSNEGGSPTQNGTCSAGSGSCYECQYVCNDGVIEDCAERSDGSGQECLELLPDEDPPGEETQDPGQGTPILIDLDMNGFHLEGLDNAVLFDLTGSGIPKYYSWTSTHTGDAFLCRDRDGSGRIENGQELFGNATILTNGVKAPHGYEALRDLDLLWRGGNEDGRLTVDEWSFHELCVWVDGDHDGISDHGEILSLGEAGVLELSYEYREMRRRDAHGNEFRYRASAVLANPQGKPRHSSTYDVFFLSKAGNL